MFTYVFVRLKIHHNSETPPIYWHQNGSRMPQWVICHIKTNWCYPISWEVSFFTKNRVLLDHIEYWYASLYLYLRISVHVSPDNANILTCTINNHIFVYKRYREYQPFALKVKQVQWLINRNMSNSLQWFENLISNDTRHIVIFYKTVFFL